MIGRLTRDAGIVIAGNVVAMIAGMAFTIVLSRHLGPADFGALSTAMAVMALKRIFPRQGASPISILRVSRGA